MAALWCQFSLGSIVCGAALDDRGWKKRCQVMPGWLTGPMLSHAARLIFHVGVSNKPHMGYADLCPQDGPAVLMVVTASQARA
jgi:hypothetical protein